MKLGNIADRAVIVTADGAADIAAQSGGRFGPDVAGVLERWVEFREWAQAADLTFSPYRESEVGPPVARPRQVFAIALNYRAHAVESGFSVPTTPSVFTKFASSIAGPTGEIALVDGDVDWEVELVAVIGTEARKVPEQRAWDHVAGLTIGQDVSERRTQLAGEKPQFSLAKSHPGFSPIGPWIVTPDELENPDDLLLECERNGDIVQSSRTSDLVFSVPALVSRLSEIVTLYPGDLIFTGTPAGVALGDPDVPYLTAGDTLTTRIEGLGSMHHRFVSATS